MYNLFNGGGTGSLPENTQKQSEKFLLLLSQVKPFF